MLPEAFALARYSSKHAHSAEHILCASDCEGPPMRDLIALADDDLKDRWDRLTLGRTQPAGLPELRERVSQEYETVNSSEILIAVPEEAVFLTMNAILNPGDHVVCAFPGHQSLYQMPITIGCEISLWEPREDQGWFFDPSELKSLIRPNTRLLIWSFPHNPTGSLPSSSAYSQMIAIAREADLWVLSDENQRLLEFDPERRLPAAVDLYAKAVSLSGMSKAYGLAGLRVGWVATHDSVLLERMKGLKDYTTVCPPTPSELLSLVALRNSERILKANVERITINMSLANAFLDRRQQDETRRMVWTPPQAGAACFPRIIDAAATPNQGATALCQEVLDETGILLLPSTVYGYGDSHIRLGLGHRDFDVGIKKLELYLTRDKSTASPAG
jgi:aspartate/methionine/tyrosine aminotransferase